MDTLLDLPRDCIARIIAVNPTSEWLFVCSDITACCYAMCIPFHVASPHKGRTFNRPLDILIDTSFTSNVLGPSITREDITLGHAQFPNRYISRVEYSTTRPFVGFSALIIVSARDFTSLTIHIAKMGRVGILVRCDQHAWEETVSIDSKKFFVEPCVWHRDHNGVGSLQTIAELCDDALSEHPLIPYYPRN